MLAPVRSADTGTRSLRLVQGCRTAGVCIAATTRYTVCPKAYPSTSATPSISCQIMRLPAGITNRVGRVRQTAVRLTLVLSPGVYTYRVPLGLEHLAESGSEERIAIVNREPHRVQAVTQVHGEVAGLLYRP